MEQLKGGAVSAHIKEQVREMISGLSRPPKLAIVRVGEKPDDLSYERGAIKKMESFGLLAQSYSFPEDISHQTFLDQFRRINEDPDIDGILLLRPLPRQIREKEITELIDPEKDLDGISPENMGRVFAGEKEAFAPCTAEAVVELLKFYEIPILGKRAVILGRSLVVGRPLAMLLMGENATVTICHTKTEHLKETCRNGEILVAAAGRPKLLDGSFVGEQAVVVDVGIHVQEDGTLCGDVDTSTLEGIAKAATPVPGGVGAVTTAVLARHLAEAALRRRG